MTCRIRIISPLNTPLPTASHARRARRDEPRVLARRRPQRRLCVHALRARLGDVRPEYRRPVTRAVFACLPSGWRHVRSGQPVQKMCHLPLQAADEIKQCAASFAGHMKRCPPVEAAGIRSTVCGPESFTPDHKPLVGRERSTIHSTHLTVLRSSSSRRCEEAIVGPLDGTVVCHCCPPGPSRAACAGSTTAAASTRWA